MNPIGSDNPPEQSHQLPDGTWVSLKVDNDYLYTEWTSFWLTFLTGKVRPAWYRVFPADALPSDWEPMKAAAVVDDQMGMGDDDSDTARDNVGKVGAARKLSRCSYVFQSKIRVGDREIELPTIDFEIRRSPRTAGWG
jgi:hypothetical protein